MNDFKVQPFYNRITKEFANTVKDLINKHIAVSIFSTFKWICWAIALLIIIGHINSFNNNTETINSFFVICIAGVLVIISEKLCEKPKKNFNKIKQKVNDELLLDICECKNCCTCKDEFREYMKIKKIDLTERAVSKFTTQ